MGGKLNANYNGQAEEVKMNVSGNKVDGILSFQSSLKGDGKVRVRLRKNIKIRKQKLEKL